MPGLRRTYALHHEHHFQPKDSNTFTSACLDRTVKMWSLASPTANFTMDAHDKGVNYVNFYPGSDKPYLITTGDDRTIKIWDYLSKSCVQTMEGHTSNPSFAAFHPNLPIIISGSEDGTVKIWNSNTYRLENTLSYALERAWCVSLRRDANEVAVGFDEGIVVTKERGDAGMKGAGSWAADAIYEGPVLGAHGKGFVIFWDWESGEIVRRIDVDAKNIFRLTTGTLVAVEGMEITDEGVEESFDVVAEISDRINIFGYSLSLSVVEYQMAVLRGDMDSAAKGAAKQSCLVWRVELFSDKRYQKQMQRSTTCHHFVLGRSRASTAALVSTDLLHHETLSGSPALICLISAFTACRLRAWSKLQYN
ncbi:WD40-repeat-containing domain protein [Suillus subluteus]|nr:WD40-repeat-containing domain protein [Suillus subluteus]